MFSPLFCHDWQRVQEAIKLHLRNIKMIKGGTRNPYKCTNVMNQEAMDDKIIERWKHVKNNACKRVLIDREVVKLLWRENPKFLMDQGFVENLTGKQRAQKFSSMDREAIEDLSRSQEEGSIERISVEDVSRSYRAWRKEVFQEGKNT